jgi:drug/metabolite transporter (DMT)-like permease
MAGIMLLLTAVFGFKRKKAIKKLFTDATKLLIFASLALAIGIFTWYDSINRIGASKELLVAGPLEIVIIVLLAKLFLKERLHRTHIVGIGVALMGFALALLSDTNLNPFVSGLSFTAASTTPNLVHIGFGELEAIISAFGFATAVLFLTKIVKTYSSMEAAGTTMFTAGVFLLAILFIEFVTSGMNVGILSMSMPSTGHTQFSVTNIIILVLFSLIPFIGSLSYSTGLSRIGASLTATIGSSSILITVFLELTAKEFGIRTHLPENVILAILAGILGFLGIYIIHLPRYSPPITKGN